MSTPVARRAHQSTAARARVLWENIRKSRTSYLFIAPFSAVFFTFTLLPVLSAVVMSFSSYDMIQQPVWVGWENYVRLLLADEVFVTAVKNTLVFAAITGPLSYLLCFVFAWLVNELRPRIRAVLTLLFYAPSITGNAYVIWTILFNGDAYGYVNGFLIHWGILRKPVLWLQDPAYMMPIVIVVMLWMSLGTSFLVFIAGFQGIDRSLYEAGAIDGIRNRWQELWFLTLPVMKRYLMFGAIISITTSFLAAAKIQELTGPAPTDFATWTVMQHLEDYGFVRYEMGYASAIAFILFVTMVVAQRAIQRMLSKVGT